MSADPPTRWAVVVPAEQWASERLFHHETVAVPGTPGVIPLAGDPVIVVAGGPQPQAVALATVRDVRGDALLLGYLRRAFDAPAPLDDNLTEAVTALTPETFDRLAARLGADRDRVGWQVSVALPIEATSPAEAVRLFWSYVRDLGPAELPTYVCPSGDELAMQSFVLGSKANQDPENDD